MNDWNKLRHLVIKLYPDEKKTKFSEISHALNTEEWLLKIFPECTEEEKIAAFAHDVERTFFGKRKQKKHENYLDHKLAHSLRSADILCSMMYALSFDSNSIERVHYLIKNHEVGGDKEANLVRDADSLSYFENNLSGYYKKRGIERTKFKIKFMYDRMSDNSKKILETIRFNKDLLDLINKTLDLDLHK